MHRERTFNLAILEKPWARLLSSYCAFVARHPWPFVVAPIVLTLFCATGILSKFHIVRGVHYLYAPMDAEWMEEENVFNTYWKASDKLFYPGKDVLRRKGLFLLLRSKDGGSVLRPEHASDFLGVLDWLETRNWTTSEGVTYGYRDICLLFRNACFNNAHARIVARAFANQNQEQLNITFPFFKTQFSSEKIDLSQSLGNATLDSNGVVQSASSWMVLYQLKQDSPEMVKLSTQFEMAIETAVRENKVPTRYLEVFHFHSSSFDNELAESNRRLIPRFSITFAILITFSIACTFNLIWVWDGRKERLVVDWVLSKPLMGIIGVITTMMAILSAMGLLLLFEVTFVDMCTVMPFLSLTIGIDDTFLMLAAWHETPRQLTVEERIRRSMRHAGVSISITSLTDSLAFLIGAISSLPAVRYFCYYSAAAIVFIFAYSMSIFVAILALQGRREQKGENSLTGRTTRQISSAEKATKVEMHLNMGSRAETAFIPTTLKIPGEGLTVNFTESRLWYARFFEEKYANFIWRKDVQLTSLLLFVLYVAGAVSGLNRLVVGFDLINIIQPDSPAHKFLVIKGQQFPESMERAEIAVLNPPNLGVTEERSRFLEVVRQFESTSCSEGPNSTDFWLHGFHDYINNLGFGELWDDVKNDKEAFTENLQPFLLSSEKYSYDTLRDSNGSISVFRFSTGLTHLSTDYSIVECCHLFRAVAKRFPEYSIFTYTPYWNLADQFEIMWPQTMQDIYVSLLVMIPVSLLFIKQPVCALMIGLNIASVAFGVLGFMAWWKVNLDATSMITIAMSVGFSVDFAAHVTYAYMTETVDKHGKMTPKERLAVTLGMVGWPVTQASSSVLLGISTLATVDSYVVQTCFKTVFLVVVFGTAHALLFLPLLLTHFHSFLEFLSRHSPFAPSPRKVAPTPTSLRF